MFNQCNIVQCMTCSPTLYEGKNPGRSQLSQGCISLPFQKAHDTFGNFALFLTLLWMTIDSSIESDKVPCLFSQFAEFDLITSFVLLRARSGGSGERLKDRWLIFRTFRHQEAKLNCKMAAKEGCIGLYKSFSRVCWKIGLWWLGLETLNSVDVNKDIKPTRWRRAGASSSTSALLQWTGWVESYWLKHEWDAFR